MGVVESNPLSRICLVLWSHWFLEDERPLSLPVGKQCPVGLTIIQANNYLHLRAQKKLRINILSKEESHSRTGLLEQKVEKFRGRRALGGSNDTSISLPLICNVLIWPSYNFRGPVARSRPSLCHADVPKPLGVMWFARGPTVGSARVPRAGFMGWFLCACCLPHHIPGFGSLQRLGEPWGLTAFVCFIGEEFGGWPWEEAYDSCDCGCDPRDKEVVHQTGLCQRFNFLYFRTGSYLNYFIDFLLPYKSSLRAGWTASLP